MQHKIGKTYASANTGSLWKVVHITPKGVIVTVKEDDPDTVASFSPGDLKPVPGKVYRIEYSLVGDKPHGVYYHDSKKTADSTILNLRQKGYLTKLFVYQEVLNV